MKKDILEIRRISKIPSDVKMKNYLSVREEIERLIQTYEINKNTIYWYKFERIFKELVDANLIHKDIDINNLTPSRMNAYMIDGLKQYKNSLISGERDIYEMYNCFEYIQSQSFKEQIRKILVLGLESLDSLKVSDAIMFGDICEVKLDSTNFFLEEDDMIKLGEVIREMQIE